MTATVLEGNVRWCREFPSADTFSQDLGGLGSLVGPPSGLLPGQAEDYVLRRVLVALHREDRLNHPLTIWASDQPGPDFLIQDNRGEWSLEVDVAGSEPSQTPTGELSESARMAIERRFLPSWRNVAIAEAIRRKQRKPGDDHAKHPGLPPCVLAIYDNRNGHSDAGSDLDSVQVRDDDGPVSWSLVASTVSDPRDVALILPSDAPVGRELREVLVVCGDGRTVYLDVFGHQQRVDIGGDYNIDLAEWISKQVDLLRAGKSAELDVEELIEELAALARRDRKALRSQLKRLMLHLLKWEAQPDKRSTSWKVSIESARDEIHELLEDSPSLCRELRDLRDVYQRARRDAATEAGLSIDALPQACPYDVSDADGSRPLLRLGWLPD